VELALSVSCKQGTNLFILHCRYFIKELLLKDGIKKADLPLNLNTWIDKLHCSVCSQVHRYDLGLLHTSKVDAGTLIV
jgi:hypothetical protein